MEAGKFKTSCMGREDREGREEWARRREDNFGCSTVFEQGEVEEAVYEVCE